MAYEFRVLTTSVGADLLSAIAEVVETVGDASVLTQDLGEPPHRWACSEVARTSSGDPTTVEVHAADDVAFADELRHLSSLRGAPDLRWVQAYWIFTVAGRSGPRLAIDLARAIAARQRAVFCDDSGFDVRLT